VSSESVTACAATGQRWQEKRACALDPLQGGSLVAVPARTPGTECNRKYLFAAEFVTPGRESSHRLESAPMRRLLLTSLAASAVAVPLTFPADADAAAPCAPGYTLSGVLCIPDPNAQAAPAPAPAPAPVVVTPAPARSPLATLPVIGPIVDRPQDSGTRRNLEPVIVAPATPAPPPPGPSGGNAVGSPGLIGPVGVGPVLPQGQCAAPLVNVIILGSDRRCTPPVVVAQPVAPAYPAPVVINNTPPTAGAAMVPQYNLPVTH
jgi:hypothetical protein